MKCTEIYWICFNVRIEDAMHLLKVLDRSHVDIIKRVV
jgi:hypothetical protein